MAAHNELGELGEKYAAILLEKKGFAITKKNWRSGRNEIDLIAEKKDLLVFVEVKTRTQSDWGHPEDFLGNAQIRRLQMAANHYIQLHNISKEIRFDVIAITYYKQEIYDITHFEDAILPSM